MKEDITLSPEQVRLFNRLKNAYKACEKAGIYFVNNYGSLEAYPGDLVDDYTDSENGMFDKNAPDIFPADELRTNYCFQTKDSFADDDHYIRLTRKGMEALNQEE